MRRFTLLLSWGCCLCVTPAVVRAADEKHPPPIRVLFIGNSYTHSNNLPEMVSTLSGGRIDARMVARGGATLQQLWDLGEAPATIREGKWDWVVIQEHSLLGGMRIDGVEYVNEPDFFYDNVRLFDAEIRKAKARTLLYMTWARRVSPQQQTHLTHAYLTIAQELNLAVAPVGVAWQKVREADPSILLHAADGTHPSPVGTYLSACVFVNAILGAKAPATMAARVVGHPIGANERPDLGRMVDLVNLTPERASFLQRIAEEPTPALSPSAVKLTYPSRASLPPVKRPVKAADVTGVWRGSLKFVAVPLNAELKIKAEGNQCTGQWSTWTNADDRRQRGPIASCRVTDVGVTFVLPDYRGFGPPETYWSHYTGETLTGWADYRGVGKSSRLMGSFELRRQRQ